MFKVFSRAGLMLLVLTLLTGVAYPLVVTGLAQVLFPHQANGSLLNKGDVVVGSALIGQNFTGPQYFHGRPSATNYDPTNSGGSNLGPTNKSLIDTIAKRADQVRAEDGLKPGAPVASDLVTASASGLDPDITPAAAMVQVARVAKARNLQEAKVKSLVQQMIKQPQLGILGEPRVNVLRLNLALDTL